MFASVHYISSEVSYDYITMLYMVSSVNIFLPNGGSSTLKLKRSMTLQGSQTKMKHGTTGLSN